jgi:hypothetical protein
MTTHAQAHSRNGRGCASGKGTERGKGTVLFCHIIIFDVLSNTMLLYYYLLNLSSTAQRGNDYQQAAAQTQ